MEEDSPVARAFHKFTYPRLRLNDHTLDDNLPVFQPQRDNDCSHALPTASIGVLDILPPELLAEILCQLDLRTLLDFRYVNSRAADLVNYLPQYKGITTHARNALRGILSIETGRWITCAALYEKLCTPVCEQCSDFGGYLYLLTCKRVCFLCLSRNPIYLPLPPGRASRKFGLQRQIVESLPRMKAIPGTYSPNEKKVAKCTLVDHESALHAGVALHGSLDAMLKHVSDAEAIRDSRSRRPRTTDPFDGCSGNPFRFVAIVRIPWLNRASQEVEWGSHCIGCEKSSRMPLHYRRQFTKVFFDRHLRQSGDIQNGKHYLG